jgi:hypothetical protein
MTRAALTASLAAATLFALGGCTAPSQLEPTAAPVVAFLCPTVAAEPTDEPPTAENVATRDVVDYTERSAMSESQFWSIISTLPSRASDADFDALSTMLAPCGVPTLVAFDARLTLLLYQLDTAPLCLWYSANGGLPGPVYSDDFLYARADTVLAGSATYHAAIAKGELRWGRSDQGTGEDLLYLAQTAADSVGETDALSAAEERDIPLSYESGTNPASAIPGDVQTACIPAS